MESIIELVRVLAWPCAILVLLFILRKGGK